MTTTDPYGEPRHRPPAHPSAPPGAPAAPQPHRPSRRRRGRRAGRVLRPRPGAVPGAVRHRRLLRRRRHPRLPARVGRDSRGRAPSTPPSTAGSASCAAATSRSGWSRCVAGLFLWVIAFSWWAPGPFFPVLAVVVLLAVAVTRSSRKAEATREAARRAVRAARVAEQGRTSRLTPPTARRRRSGCARRRPGSTRASEPAANACVGPCRSRSRRWPRSARRCSFWD